MREQLLRCTRVARVFCVVRAKRGTPPAARRLRVGGGAAAARSSPAVASWAASSALRTSPPAAAAMVVVGAVGVITFRNPVHSAISLILTLLGVAVAFVEQEAHFLAAVQIIVYAGAIVVLFLFVIMFLGVDEREDVSVEPLVGQRPLAYASVFVTVGGIVAMLGYASLCDRV